MTPILPLTVKTQTWGTSPESATAQRSQVFWSLLNGAPAHPFCKHPMQICIKTLGPEHVDLNSMGLDHPILKLLRDIYSRMPLIKICHILLKNWHIVLRNLRKCIDCLRYIPKTSHIIVAESYDWFCCLQSQGGWIEQWWYHIHPYHVGTPQLYILR